MKLTKKMGQDEEEEEEGAQQQEEGRPSRSKESRV